MRSMKALMAAMPLCATLALTVAAEAKDKVAIAFIGPLTGGNAATGLGGRNSALLAIQLRNKEQNAKYEYGFVAYDDECKPNIGVQVATKAAIDRRIVAGITHYCSAVGIATVDTYHRFGLPVVVWGAILPEITYGNNYPEIHRVNGTMINEARLAASFFKDQGIKSVVMLYDTTDYGKGQFKYFSEFLKDTGVTLSASIAVGPDQQDLSAELTKIKEIAPQAVFVGGVTPLGVRARVQMDRFGVKAIFAGVSGIMSTGFLDGAAGAAEGTVSFHNGAPLSAYPQGAAFLAAYHAAGFKEDPDAYGPFAYTAANLIMDAIEKVGPDREKVRDELNHTKGYKALVGEVNFDDHRQNIVTAHAYVVQDGKWVYWPDSDYASGKRKLTGM